MNKWEKAKYFKFTIGTFFLITAPIYYLDRILLPIVIPLIAFSKEFRIWDMADRRERLAIKHEASKIQG